MVADDLKAGWFRVGYVDASSKQEETIVGMPVVETVGERMGGEILQVFQCLDYFGFAVLAASDVVQEICVGIS